MQTVIQQSTDTEKTKAAHRLMALISDLIEYNPNVSHEHQVQFEELYWQMEDEYGYQGDSWNE